jgi:hypothetical protein
MRLKNWPIKMPYVYKDFYVVCSWYDFGMEDFERFEGKTTIAIVHKIENAKLIYNNTIE